MKFLAILAAGLGLSLTWGLSAAPAQESWAPRTWPGAWAALPATVRAGATAAQSLEGVGARLPRDQLQVVLTQPRQLYPGAKMPSYAYLPAEERQALLDFLSNLKSYW